MHCSSMAAGSVPLNMRPPVHDPEQYLDGDGRGRAQLVALPICCAILTGQRYHTVSLPTALTLVLNFSDSPLFWISAFRRAYRDTLPSAFDLSVRARGAGAVQDTRSDFRHRRTSLRECLLPLLCRWGQKFESDKPCRPIMAHAAYPTVMRSFNTPSALPDKSSLPRAPSLPLPSARRLHTSSVPANLTLNPHLCRSSHRPLRSPASQKV